MVTQNHLFYGHFLAVLRVISANNHAIGTYNTSVNRLATIAHGLQAQRQLTFAQIRQVFVALANCKRLPSNDGV
jgi:hypothetical protein